MEAKIKYKSRVINLVLSISVIILSFSLYSFRSEIGITEKYNPVEATAKQESNWENLKVLPQDISKDSLKHLMKNYSLSLGVDCNHSHAVRKEDPTKLDFASDDKVEKEIARGMIKMTNDLNANYFQPHFPEPKPDQVEVINCVMCHRGTVNPEKHLSRMKDMYKTYDSERDNRKEKIIEMRKKK